MAEAQNREAPGFSRESVTVTTVVATTVQVRLTFGASAEALCFTLSWPGGQACLTLDCPGMATVLGEGDGALAALQEWQAALAVLARHLSPAPPVSPVSAPLVMQPVAPASAIPLVEPAALAGPVVEPLAMTAAQVQDLTARWNQAQATAAVVNSTAAGAART